MTTSKQISDTIETGIQVAEAAGDPQWLGATNALIDLFAEHGECFSSGEIAAHMRTYRPDLMFSVTTSVGSHVRDRFWGDTMPLYEHDDGTHSPMEMGHRLTEGFTRTPVGTLVFVYGPNRADIEAHGFEVDIPQPGTQVPADPQDADGLPAKPVQKSSPIQHFTTITPRLRTDLKAIVHEKDGRCCIPRACLETLIATTGATLKGGDSVYIVIDGDECRVYLEEQDGSRSYSVWATSGRVYFSKPGTTFVKGDAFKVTVDASDECLIVDLSAKV
jgi:hypothetical protein